MIKKYSLLLLLISLMISCNSPNLNGHYHLEWNNNNNNNTSFQTWNFKNNRIKINDSICNYEKETCFGMPIEFKGDSIYIPWVDFIFEAKYHIDKNGIIYLEDGSGKPMKLLPKKDCLNSSVYFNQKTQKLTNNFNLLSTYMMYGKSVFPKDYHNELIIGRVEAKPFYLFNNNLLRHNKNNYDIEKVSKKEELWIHVDEKIKLSEVLNILKEVHQKGYKILFTSKETSENDEQIKTLKKSIINIDKKLNEFEINSCEYCEKHPTKKIDSILNFKIFGLDSCIVNNKITDFFQLRNHTVRMLKRNRNTRLNTEIQLEINSNILFKDYLELMTEIDFVNTALLVTYYRDENDPEQKEILNKQNSRNRKDLELDFPLRVKETIKPF
jgi:hypothetical protein